MACTGFPCTNWNWKLLVQMPLNRFKQECQTWDKMYLTQNDFFWSPPMALINDNRPFCANTYCNGQKWNPSTALLSKIGWHYRLLTPQCKDPPSNPSLKRVPLKCFSFNKLHRFPYDAKFRLSFFNAMGGPTSTHWVHYKRLCKVYASCFKNMQVEVWPLVFLETTKRNQVKKIRKWSKRR